MNLVFIHLTNNSSWFCRYGNNNKNNNNNNNNNNKNNNNNNNKNNNNNNNKNKGYEIIIFNIRFHSDRTYFCFKNRNIIICN